MERGTDRRDARRPRGPGGAEPDERLAADPRGGHGFERFAAAAGVARAPRARADGRQDPGGRAMIRAVAGLVAVLPLVAGAGTPPASGMVPHVASFPVAALRPPLAWKPIPVAA